MLRKVLLFTYFLLVHLQKSPLVGILKLKDNLIHNINEFIHETINRLFLSIKLNVNFTESPHVKMLLTMHNDLNNIAEKNCKIYTEIIKFIRANNKTFNLDMNEILDKFVKELPNNRTGIDLRNNVKHKKVARVNSMESLDFVDEFLEKINNLTVKDFINETVNKTRLNNGTKPFAFRKINKLNNLKAWSPPSFNERIEDGYKQIRRIYNGKRTRINQYPFMVSIHLGKQFLCAGSFISKDLVITAASCLQLVYNNKNLRNKPSSMHVRFASDYTKKSGDTVPVMELHIHPLYNTSTLKNNLAVIKMSPQTRFSTRRKIRRIVYDMDADRLRGISRVTVLGWGATDHVLDPKHFQPLAVSKIDVYNFNKCQDIFSKHYVSEENFCVGFEGKGGGACDGDVGGPGIVDKILLGVISFGSPVCGDPDMPTVFTKLGYYANWINSFISNEPSVNRNSKSLRTDVKEKYSEEVMILNQLLNDLILSNASLLDEFLYGDIDNDFEEIFNVSTTHDPLQHPLVNKSVYLIPHIHDFGNYNNSATVVLTTSSPIGPITPHPGWNIEYMDNTEDKIKVIEYAYPWLTARPEDGTVSTTITIKETTHHISDIVARTRMGDEFFDIFKDESRSTDEKSKTFDVISDNYETGSYESLSVDVNSKDIDNSKKYFTKINDKGRKFKRKIYKDIKAESSKDRSMIFSDKNLDNKHDTILNKFDTTNKVELRKVTDNFNKNKDISSSLDNFNEVETEKQFEVGHLYE